MLTNSVCFASAQTSRSSLAGAREPRSGSQDSVTNAHLRCSLRTSYSSSTRSRTRVSDAKAPTYSRPATSTCWTPCPRRNMSFKVWTARTSSWTSATWQAASSGLAISLVYPGKACQCDGTRRSPVRVTLSSSKDQIITFTSSSLV